MIVVTAFKQQAYAHIKTERTHRSPGSNFTILFERSSFSSQVIRILNIHFNGQMKWSIECHQSLFTYWNFSTVSKKEITDLKFDEDYFFTSLGLYTVYICISLTANSQLFLACCKINRKTADLFHWLSHMSDCLKLPENRWQRTANVVQMSVRGYHLLHVNMLS